MFLSDGSSKYFRFGWHDDLILISIPINTKIKYIFLNIFIGIIRIVEVIIQEIAHPIIEFTIYNPDKKVITQFSRYELQLYGNLMYFIDNFKRIVMLLITISQFDLALISMLFGEIATVFTINYILSEKKFVEKKYIEEVVPLI